MAPPKKKTPITKPQGDRTTTVVEDTTAGSQPDEASKNIRDGWEYFVTKDGTHSCRKVTK